MSLVKWFFEGHTDCRRKKERERENQKKKDIREEVKRSRGLLGQYCCFQRRFPERSLVREKKRSGTYCTSEAHSKAEYCTVWNYFCARKSFAF